jgi:tRNA pseudouridine32 synthase / 23S rRNA pseudouridine746 synthase
MILHMGRSRLYLPKRDSPPATILDHLIVHFANVPAEIWRERVERGHVISENGAAVTATQPYQHGITIFYEREVAEEPPALESETILHQDSEILIADKPHGMPVTPAGDYVERTLLFRLQKSTGLTDLTPIHRLDRDTAGLVLFSTNEETRGRYHRLFEKKSIHREYLAVAHFTSPSVQKHWLIENRIDVGQPWFTQRIVEGLPNAKTAIELLAASGNTGLFRLTPSTGKKHQLRVHMLSIGAPIVGDPLYPTVREIQEGDPPLQLLASRLGFADPVRGTEHSFASLRKLQAQAVF